jgi:hypothetical protein
VLKSVAGRQVQLNPLQIPSLPVRSRRVGLRHMQSIGAKRLVCPSGEQIVNGGFENAWTGWEHGADAEIWDEGRPETGIYCAGLYKGSWIQQLLAEPILKACIEKFELWIKGTLYIVWSKANIKIIYSDDTSTTIPFQEYEAGVWKKIDLLSYVEDGKSVKGIYIINTSGQFQAWIWVDDVSLIGLG